MDQGQNMLSPFVNQHLTLVFRLRSTCCRSWFHAFNGRTRICRRSLGYQATCSPHCLIITDRSVSQLSDGRCSHAIEQASLELLSLRPHRKSPVWFTSKSDKSAWAGTP